MKGETVAGDDLVTVWKETKKKFYSSQTKPTINENIRYNTTTTGEKTIKSEWGGGQGRCYLFITHTGCSYLLIQCFFVAFDFLFFAATGSSSSSLLASLSLFDEVVSLSSPSSSFVAGFFDDFLAFERYSSMCSNISVYSSISSSVLPRTREGDGESMGSRRASTYPWRTLRCILPCATCRSSFVGYIHCRREKSKLFHVG